MTALRGRMQQRATQVSGRWRAPRAMSASIGPGHSAETPILVPSSSCSSASDSDSAAYLHIE